MHSFSSVNPTTQSSFIDKLEESQPKNTQESATQTYIQIVEEAKPAEKDCNNNQRKILTTELTLVNFKQSMVDETSQAFDKIKDSVLIEHFSMVINNLSDEEKVEKFAFVQKEFQSKPILIAEFLKSIKDKNLASQCADKIDFNTFVGGYGELGSDIVKLMSKDKIIKYLQIVDYSFKKFYEEKGEIIDRVLDKISAGEKLSEEELVIKKQLDTYCELATILQVGIAENETMSEEEKQETQEQFNKILQQCPPAFYNMYVQSLADFVSRNQDMLKNENLIEILDKATGNKFSEELKIVNEKSAVDKETGMLKTAPAEVIAKSEEKIEEIKKTITDSSDSQVLTDDGSDDSFQPTDTNAIDYELLTGNGNVAVLKDVFTGKIKISEYLEQTAIKQYKLMDTALQGEMLLSASGKFFNDLVKNTKSATLENLLSIGWKGKSYDATQKVKNEVEERKDDVA